MNDYTANKRTCKGIKDDSLVVDAEGFYFLTFSEIQIAFLRDFIFAYVSFYIC